MSSAATQGSLQIVLRQNIARQIVSIQGWKEVGRSSGAPLHETLNKLTAVETESCAMTYLDVWRSGTFPEKQQVLPIANMDCRTTECSTSDSLGDISLIQKAALQLYRRNVPFLHMSRHVTACDSALPGLPPH